MTSRGDHIRLEKGAVVKHHYEVVTSVGSGNFSKVYRVLDLQLSSKEQKRRPLAMKVIKKEYSSDAKYEKQMLITLHKNDKNHTARVSKMHECFLYQDCPVFIMPIHGPSIRNRRLGINRGVVTHDKLLEFAYDILETMDFVHFQCNMVHTDLKPENILIADCNVAENSMGDAWVVCDFGSASLWRLDKLDSDLISTRPYRAPEVVLGNKWHYAADMWSVGCILYEVAVGHRLFEIRDDLTHLHMMDRRLGRLPEAFTKSSRYASKFFNTRGEFLSTPDVIRFGKCRLTPLKEMFRDDRNFLHLLEGLFVYDPSRRMTATEALALPMFNEVRAARRRRTEREAEEAEARRERRRAASAAAASATTTAPATTNATGDSLMSTFNSLNDTVNTRLTDRTDRNTLESTGESKKLHHSTKFAVAAADMDGGAAESPPAAVGRPKPSGADAVSESRGTPSPHTGRSTTETATTATSRISVNVSPQKEGGKSRATTGSASPHSTVTASSSGGGHGKAVKPRGRAVSTPAAITKEVPSHRPVVDNHRASTGATTLATTTTTVVPKLALGRILSGGDSRSPSTTTTTAAATTSKVARSAGEGGISKAARHANGQPGRASGLRTASPAERHAPGSAAPADVAVNLTGASKPTGSRTPRKNAHGSRRSSAMSVDETAVRNITAGSAKEGDAADAPAVTPHTPDSAGASASDVPRMVRGAAARATPFIAAQSQTTNYNTASSTAAATSAPAPSTAAAEITSTPVRAPSTTPLGYLSPLERGMTAAGITTRTEPPVDINSPEQHEEKGEGARAGKSRRGSSNVETEDEATTNAASEGEASSLPSPVANHTDGSPRATDYRSPVRRRPAPVVTPTDDTSAPTSPEVARRSPRASMSPMLTMEKVLSHPFPQTQPAPNLAVPAAQSEGHRTPREVSPAPVTGRGGSPVTTARRLSQPAALQAPATGGAAATAEADAYVLASTVPIVRAPPSRGTSRSGSLASTLVTTPSVDAPVRTLGSGATFTSSTGAAPALPAAAAEAQATASSQAGHSTRLRSPLQSSLTPRSSANAGAAAAVTRTGATSGTSAGGVLQPVSAVPSNASSAHLGNASTSAAGAPSMKPVINVSAATADRLKSVPPASIADVRGPSAIPVSASRRTVVKPSPAPPSTPISTTTAAADTSTPTTATSNSVSASGRSGIPEHPVARPVTPTPSAPRASEGASHLPEAVTRSRERSLAVGEAEREKEKERAASRRGSANSSLSALHPTIEAATPKTPLPSATGAAGTASLSSSLSLPSTASHPTVGVVRQRSGSTQLVAGHTSGLESNPALSMTSTAAGHGLLYTPRGSRVLTEHSLTASGRSSAAPLPAVVPGAPASSPPLTSSQGSGRTLMTLATPGAAAQDGDAHCSRPAEHTVESRPTTPRGSGRTSVKSLDLHKLHPSSSTGTSGTRPPRSSLGGRTASRSPAAPAGGRSPRSSGRPGPGSSHSGQAALNASTSSLHLGVTRSPRRPVAPGAGSNSGAASLMASMDGSHTAAVVRSPRSPRSSSRGANSPRGSASSKAPAKTVSPRRAQLSPRLAPSAVAAEHASEVPLVSVSTPTQPLPPSTPAQGGPARLSQPRRSITVISSKPASSAQLSRYSSAAAVAPTRASAQRPPPTDMAASTGKLPSSGGLSASYNAPAGAAGSSVATIIAPTSRQNSFPESANTSTTEGDVAASSPPAAAASSAAKYRRDARTLKRIVVSRPSPQSSGASMVSPQELVDEDGSSLSPAASIN